MTAIANSDTSAIANRKDDLLPFLKPDDDGPFYDIYLQLSAPAFDEQEQLTIPQKART
jgi:hypothetical protein